MLAHTYLLLLFYWHGYVLFLSLALEQQESEQQPGGSGSNILTMVVVVACTLILLAAIVVATVLIIRSRKSSTTPGNGNVDVGQHLYENHNFHIGHGTTVNDISRSYENTEIRTEESVS